MQIFGLGHKTFMVHEFLKVQLKDAFIFKQNNSLYLDYIQRIKEESAEIINPQRVSYRTFTNAIDVLEENKIVIQKKEGKDNKEQTALIDIRKKYKAELVKIEVEKKQVILRSLCENKHYLKVKCEQSDELFFLPIKEKVMFTGEYLQFLDGFIVLNNISNLRIIRRWY